jgi:hypothetical protein
MSMQALLKIGEIDQPRVTVLPVIGRRILTSEHVQSRFEIRSFALTRILT